MVHPVLNLSLKKSIDASIYYGNRGDGGVIWNNNNNDNNIITNAKEIEIERRGL